MSPPSDLKIEAHPFEPAGNPSDPTCRQCGFVYSFGALHYEPDPQEPKPDNTAWQYRDLVLNPATGAVFEVRGDGSGGKVFQQLAPASAWQQDNPPADAVLLVRWIDGKPQPVADFGDAGQYAVEVVA